MEDDFFQLKQLPYERKRGRDCNEHGVGVDGDHWVVGDDAGFDRYE